MITNFTIQLLVMDYQVEEWVRVTNQHNGHEFALDTEVQILKINEKTGGFKCTDGDEIWWLTAKEFEKIN